MTAVTIQYDQLSLEALHGVIEEFVTRDGTDYGVVEISLETKYPRYLVRLSLEKQLLCLTRKLKPVLF